MNIFKAVICHDYTVLRAQRKSHFVKTNGVHMIGVSWVANVLTIVGISILYLLLTKPKRDVVDLLDQFHYWELAGRVAIIILLAFVYIFSFAFFGGKAFFLRTIHEFIALDYSDQVKVAKRGGSYFYGSLIIFALVAGALFYIVRVSEL